jgi:uncharacterized membrane protein YphA (DoxX/SURF4 family)
MTLVHYLVAHGLQLALVLILSLLAATGFFTAGTKSLGQNPDQLQFPALLGLLMLVAALVVASTL